MNIGLPIEHISEIGFALKLAVAHKSNSREIKKIRFLELVSQRLIL